MEREYIPGNKLIAEFMGYEYTPSPIPIPNLSIAEKQFGWTKKEDWYPWYMKMKDESDNPMKRYHLSSTNDGLQFHRLWEWIMPVVEKINSIGEWAVVIHPTQCFITDNDKDIKFNSYQELSGSLLLAVRETVIKFIEWHSQQLENQK